MTLDPDDMAADNGKVLAAGTGSRSRSLAGPAHVELFYSQATGEPIQVWCDCAMGRLHTHQQWIDRFQAPRKSRGPMPRGQEGVADRRGVSVGDMLFTGDDADEQSE